MAAAIVDTFCRSGQEVLNENGTADAFARWGGLHVVEALALLDFAVRPRLR
jgi:hypothetical protein